MQAPVKQAPAEDIVRARLALQRLYDAAIRAAQEQELEDQETNEGHPNLLGGDGWPSEGEYEHGLHPSHKQL